MIHIHSIFALCILLAGIVIGAYLTIKLYLIMGYEQIDEWCYDCERSLGHEIYSVGRRLWVHKSVGGHLCSYCCKNYETLEDKDENDSDFKNNINMDLP